MKYLVIQLPAVLAMLILFSPPVALGRDADQALKVIDLRPKEEKSGDGLLPLTGPCNEGVSIVADSASKPAKIAVLQSDLAKLPGAASNGKTLTVLNWTIYYSRQMYGGPPRSGIVSSSGNPLPGMTLPGNPPQGDYPGSKCSRQESTGGWFVGSEVSGKFSPLVSVLQGTFGGSPVSVRIVYSPTRKIEGKFKGEVTDSLAVLGAVHQTAGALAAMLSK